MSEAGTTIVTAVGSGFPLASTQPTADCRQGGRNSTLPLRPRLEPMMVMLMGVPSRVRPEVGPPTGEMEESTACAYV